MPDRDRGLEVAGEVLVAELCGLHFGELGLREAFKNMPLLQRPRLRGRYFSALELCFTVGEREVTLTDGFTF